MFTPRRFLSIVALLGAVGFQTAAWSYGGGGGGSSGCEDPKFLKPVPVDGSTVPSLSEFAFLASDTDASTLVVEINGAAVPTQITPLRSGDLQVNVLPPAPISQAGKVRITAKGQSPAGCAGFTAFYINVQP
ncbi:hypothetical protein [Methylotetracoccus oryzae]|uniref:hypothetical protein n=1 Tax=Methylotetracoccus oryzae TaxID=1919059 RepID=UPI0011195EFD|nr:hypothetical protein [Methylotetracoccus oryzae]